VHVSEQAGLLVVPRGAQFGCPEFFYFLFFEVLLSSCREMQRWYCKLTHSPSKFFPISHSPSTLYSPVLLNLLCGGGNMKFGTQPEE
jgi:hypothetical protein